jgi:hypothetical protein
VSLGFSENHCPFSNFSNTYSRRAAEKPQTWAKFNKEFILEVRRPPRLRALRKLREISWARSHPA